MEKPIEKKRIIREYFEESISYGELAKRYGLCKQTVWLWIKKHKQEHGIMVSKSSQDEDIQDYKKELERSRLEVKLLKRMIDIAEEEFDIDIRKKFGARQS